MRTVRKLKVIIITIILLISTAACTATTGNESESFGIYRINSKQTALVKEDYTIRSDITSDKIRELLEELSTERVEDDSLNPIPGEVSVVDFELVDGVLLLHFDANYGQLSGIREVLLRAAVVKTFLQMEEVGSVSFYVGEEPLKDAYGNVVGVMTADSFLDTFGEREEALESDSFVLYYGTEDGRKLIRKKRMLHFNNTMSREAVVLSYLSRSPGTKDGAQAVLSPGTKILSVTTKEGICHVNLDSSFLSQQSGVSTETAVYGIVNSLTEFDEINKVEISVDSQAEGMVPEILKVNGVYEANMSLVVNNKKD